jgi:homoserine dehydrogenase
MKQYRICFLGFGNVGRALARLLSAKSSELRANYGIDWQITGVGTRRMGWRSYESECDVSALLSNSLTEYQTHKSIEEWLNATKPDVVVETISLNPEDGQPAIDYLRAALNSGAHAISANKAPLVYAYDELSSLAIKVGKRYLFESAVLDSAPVFSLFRETLPVTKIRGFSGVFNSTTNVIIETMEAGRSFAEGVKTAQELGVAETDPTNDIEGWDAIMKVCAIANVILRAKLQPTDVRREGIRGLEPETLQRARAEGMPYKLIARAKLNEDGSISAMVRPEQVALSDPLGSIRGTSLAVHFELDVIPGLTIISHRPNLQSTAYGLLADLVNALNLR